MKIKLALQAVIKFIMGLAVFMSLLLIPAGTLSYWNAWLLLALLFIPIFSVGLVLFIKNPDLLRKRLQAKEKERTQKGVLFLGGLMFISGLLTAGFDFRYQWFVIPKWIVIAASVIFLFSYMLYVLVLKQNQYLSRTVEIQKNQKVIDTGLYGIIRHPMYLSTLLLFLSMPLVLGSIFSFIIFLIYPFILVIRIKNEEQLLEKELEGYSDYKKRVKNRLIPFIW